MDRLAELPNVLDTFPHTINITSTPIEVVGRHKVMGKAMPILKTAKWHTLVPFISSRYAKQLNPWPNSLASRTVIYNWLSACIGKMEPLKDNLSTRGRLTSLRNKSQQK